MDMLISPTSWGLVPLFDWSNTYNAVDYDCGAVVRTVGIGTGLGVGTT